MDMSVDIMLSE